MKIQVSKVHKMQSVQFLNQGCTSAYKKAGYHTFLKFWNLNLTTCLYVSFHHSHTDKLLVLTHCFLKLVSYNDNMKTNIYIHKSAKTIHEDERLEFHIFYTSHHMANVAVCLDLSYKIQECLFMYNNVQTIT